MSRFACHSCHRTLIALLAAALLSSGCASVAPPPTATVAPTATAVPASIGPSPTKTADPAQALQASVEAAVQATRAAQSAAATSSVPTLTPRPTIPLYQSVLNNTEPFRDSRAGIAGLKPVGWLVAGAANAVTISSGSNISGTITATLTDIAQLSADGPVAATRTLFTQIKQSAQSPPIQVAEEFYETAGGGRLIFSAGANPTAEGAPAVTTYARATITERGMLTAIISVPAVTAAHEEPAIYALLDAIKLSGDQLGSLPCVAPLSSRQITADGLMLELAQSLGIDLAQAQQMAKDLGLGPSMYQWERFDPIVAYDSAISFAGGGIGDFDGDGRQDVAAVINSTSTNDAPQLYVMLQSADKTLRDPLCFNTEGGAQALAVGDLNSDGRDDVALNGPIGQISVFLSASEGIFGSRLSITAGRDPDALAVGDLNGDGRADVVVSHANDEVVGIFLQQDNGELGPMLSLPSDSSSYHTLAVGDINGDQLLDVVRSRRRAETHLELFLQHADHTFADATGYTTDLMPDGMAIGDVTGDGRNDVVLSGGGNKPAAKVVIFAQGQDGRLKEQASYPTYDIPSAVRIADIDGDGRSDVILLHDGWNAVSVLRQQPDGTLAEGEIFINFYDPSGSNALDIGDLNNDGRLDVLVAGVDGMLLLYGRAP